MAISRCVTRSVERDVGESLLLLVKGRVVQSGGSRGEVDVMMSMERIKCREGETTRKDRVLRAGRGLKKGNEIGNGNDVMD